MKKLIIIILLLLLGGCANSPMGASLATDTLSINGKDKQIAFTDDNTGETLIIKTDKEHYSGFGSVDVIFGITNIGKQDENVKISFTFDNKNVEVNKINLFDKNRTETKIVQECTTQSVPVKTATGTINKLEQFCEMVEKEVINTLWIDKTTAEKEALNIIKARETVYFKTILNFKPSKGRDKFSIKAVGDKGGRGELDPTTIFEETFEDCDAGAIAGNSGCPGWSTIAGWGTDITRQSLGAESSSYSAGDASTGDDGVRDTSLSITGDSPTDNYELNFDVRFASASAGECQFRTYDGGNILTYVRPSPFGTLVLESGSGNQTIVNYSADTWYNITCEWDWPNDLQRCKADDGSWTNWVNFGSNKAASDFDTVLIHQNGTTACYFDNVRVVDNTASGETIPTRRKPSNPNYFIY